MPNHAKITTTAASLERQGATWIGESVRVEPAEDHSFPDMQALEIAEGSLREVRNFLIKARNAIHAGALSHIDDVTDPHLRCARALNRRQKRAELFGKNLFADPAWDTLLLLFSEAPVRDRLTTRELLKTGVPQTTILRWLDVLEEHGLIWRSDDPTDRRLRLVGLTERASRLLTSYFSY